MLETRSKHDFNVNFVCKQHSRGTSTIALHYEYSDFSHSSIAAGTGICIGAASFTASVIQTV